MSTPTLAYVSISPDLLDLLTKVAEDARGLLDCNCSYDASTEPAQRCDGSCTYSMAARAVERMKQQPAVALDAIDGEPLIEASLFEDSNTGQAAARAAADLLHGWGSYDDEYRAKNAHEYQPYDVEEVCSQLQAWKRKGCPTAAGGAR